MASWIDHVVLAAATLEAGIAHVEALTGVAPVFGGRHEGNGTHNALLSLGAPSYLEVLAPDPEQNAPSALLGETALDTPRLHAFAVGCDDLDAAVVALRAGGVDAVGDPFAMQRRGPDGTELAWRLAFVGSTVGGARPFLIEWGSTPSPAETAVLGGRLVSLTAGDPHPDEARLPLDVLGVDVAVTESSTPWLRVIVAVDSRTIELT